MTDRLAEIEHRSVVCRGIAYTAWCTDEDADWLLAEVKRLRALVIYPIEVIESE